jgi:hypothetical protein
MRGVRAGWIGGWALAIFFFMVVGCGSLVFDLIFHLFGKSPTP